MKSFLPKLLIASCLMGLVTIGFAQNEGKKKKGGAADPTAKLRKSLEESDLGADLKEKIGKIIDEHAPKLKEAQAKVDGVLTDDQRRAKKAAQKAAKDAGKKGKEAAAEVAAAVKLTDEQQKKSDEATAELNAARAEMNKAINALLTDEQQQKLGTKGGKGKKKKNQ
jgi:Skp family chaperone for outer membrane proteins